MNLKYPPSLLHRLEDWSEGNSKKISVVLYPVFLYTLAPYLKKNYGFTEILGIMYLLLLIVESSYSLSPEIKYKMIFSSKLSISFHIISWFWIFVNFISLVKKLIFHLPVIIQMSMTNVLLLDFPHLIGRKAGI